MKTRAIYWRLNEKWERIGTVSLNNSKITRVDLNPAIDGTLEIEELLNALLQKVGGEE